MAEKLMKEGSDDMLREILVRLPDARSAIQTSLVCKRWHSLITNQFFKNRFTEIHPKVSEIMINCTSERAERATRPRTFYRLSHSSEPTTCDLPLSDVVIRATYGDLILVSKGIMQYFLCSRLTNQSIALPEILPSPTFNSFQNNICANPGNHGYAIAFSQIERRYKVMIIYFTCWWGNKMYSFWVQSFDTQTKAWRLDMVKCPFLHYVPESGFLTRFCLHIVQTQRGVLYWLDGLSGSLLNLIEFNSFSLEGRVVAFPPRFNHVDTYQRCFSDIYRLGVVCDRVRLSQLLRAHDGDASPFELLIWELDASSSSWALVHEVSLEAPTSLMFLLAMDSVDGDIIFLVRDAQIFRFAISKNEYHRVSSFPGNSKWLNELVVARFLTVLKVDHTAWPTSTSLFLS